MKLTDDMKLLWDLCIKLALWSGQCHGMYMSNDSEQRLLCLSSFGEDIDVMREVIEKRLFEMLDKDQDK